MGWGGVIPIGEFSVETLSASRLQLFPLCSITRFSPGGRDERRRLRRHPHPLDNSRPLPEGEAGVLYHAVGGANSPLPSGEERVIER